MDTYVISRRDGAFYGQSSTGRPDFHEELCDADMLSIDICDFLIKERLPELFPHQDPGGYAIRRVSLDDPIEVDEALILLQCKLVAASL